MPTSSGSNASILMVTAHHGQFGSASGVSGRDGVVCGTMATAIAATIVNDVQHHPLTDMLGAGTRTDDLVRHNNNKTAVLTNLTTEIDPVSSPTHHRRRSSNKSGPSLLSASITGSHKDQVGSTKEDRHTRQESTKLCNQFSSCLFVLPPHAVDTWAGSWSVFLLKSCNVNNVLESHFHNFCLSSPYSMSESFGNIQFSSFADDHLFVYPFLNSRIIILQYLVSCVNNKETLFTRIFVCLSFLQRNGRERTSSYSNLFCFFSSPCSVYYDCLPVFSVSLYGDCVSWLHASGVEGLGK